MNRLLRASTLSLALCALSFPAHSQKASSTRKAPSAATKAAPAPSVYYDFKGARLGMALSEWKALPAPVVESSYTSKMEGPLQVWCTSDVGSDGKSLSGIGYPSKVEQSLGVVICRYGRLFSSGSYRSVSPAIIKIGQLMATDVEYKFLDGRLYQIDITGSDGLLSEVMDGLTAKFGPPTSEINDTTQNRAGATFPHTVKVWTNPVATIRVESPWTRIDNLNVNYSDVAAIARVNAAEKAANPAADKM